jgi:hypothetical protein
MVSLAVGVFVYFVLWSGLRREQFRCQVRRIRDDLFDFMWEKGLDFKEPAYLKARETMNTILALSNQLSPTVLIMACGAAVLQWRRYGASPANPLPDGLLGEKLRNSYLAIAWTVIEFSFLKRIPGLLINSTVWVLIHAFHLGNRMSYYKGRITKDGADYLQETGGIRPFGSTG